MATYLDVVNNVLRRLREPVVSGVNDTDYSAMLGVFVNDAKRDVEDAYDWNALSSTLSASTTAGVSNYSLVGSKTRFRVVDVSNETDQSFMSYAASSWMSQQFLLANPDNGKPAYYNFNGVDSNGDTQVDIYPIPDGAYTLRFNLIVPQSDLVEDSTRILVPDHLVAMLAYSKAIAERGEDAGVQSSEAYLQYRLALSDAIAIERNHYQEEMEWVPV